MRRLHYRIAKPRNNSLTITVLGLSKSCRTCQGLRRIYRYLGSVVVFSVLISYIWLFCKSNHLLVQSQHFQYSSINPIPPRSCSGVLRRLVVVFILSMSHSTNRYSHHGYPCQSYRPYHHRVSLRGQSRATCFLDQVGFLWSAVVVLESLQWFELFEKQICESFAMMWVMLCNEIASGALFHLLEMEIEWRYQVHYEVFIVVMVYEVQYHCPV